MTHSGGVFFKAAALTVADDDIRYYADVQDAIVIDGNTYQPMPMSWSGLTQKSDTPVLAVQVTVPDINGQVSAFAEGQSLLGQPITLVIAHRDLLDVANSRDVLNLEVLMVSWKQWATVSLTCGLSLALQEQVPSSVITRTRYPGCPDLLRRASIL